MRKTKLRKTYNILIRLAIILLTLGFLYDQIFYRKDLQSILEFFPRVSGTTRFTLLMILTILLLPLNQFLEIVKWKFLIDKLEHVSIWTATKAVLTGISVSMFMPNRVGDYLGRVFVLRKADRLQAVLVTMIGSLAQLLSTVLFGLVAVLFLFPFYWDLDDQFNLWVYSGVILMVLIMGFTSVFAYVNFASFSDVVRRISGRFYGRIKKYAEVFAMYDVKNLLIVLLLSLLRYLVFSFQFWLLLKAFMIPVPYFDALVLIGLIYLLMTIIPTIALTELGIRGSVSLFVFGMYLEPLQKWTDQVELGVVSASTLLWLINLAVPALLGAIFVYSLRFFRKYNNNGH